MVNKCWPKLYWWKIWCLSFLKPCHMLFYHSQNILKFLLKIHHFLCTKLCENLDKKKFIGKFLKSIVIWRSNDFGDQKVSNGPLKTQICSVVPNILHTYTVQFLRYWIFLKPPFFTFWPKSQHKSTFEAYYFKRALKEGFLIFSPNIFFSFQFKRYDHVVNI